MEVTILADMIARIKRDADKFVVDVQAAAIQAVYHSVKSSNITPSQQLYDALNTAHRKDSLLAYLENFGNVAWSKTEKKIVFFDREKILGKDKAIAWTDEYAEKVAANKWDQAKPAPAPKSIYDCEEEVKRFIKSMEKAIVKGGAKNSNFYDAVVAAYNNEQLGLQDAMYCGFAVRALTNGETPEELVKTLVSKGCDETRAKEIIAEFDVVGNS